jgi:S-adenosylmethionine:tRNA ribosyltransferase-isomerase
MRVAAFDYDLRPESIAQRPLAERDSARLLVLPREGQAMHRAVRDLAELLPAGSLLVLNDTRVMAARLLGRKRGSGGKAEILLLRRLSGDDERQRWQAVGRASKGLGAGCIIECGDVRVEILGEVEGRDGESPSQEGRLREVAVYSEGASLADALSRAGRVPLPPYIRRPDDEGDRERYQTVFARVPGAVAAPTAGLHFTDALLERIRARGCSLARVTLHVGLGTFAPVVAGDLDQHEMHEEDFEVTADAANAVREARRRAAPVVAVGTTVVRALESCADAENPGLVKPTLGSTRLLIQPGYRFRVVDRLLTNFHVPRSTLLALVCAFGGTDRVLDAYGLAQREGYRFLSYGDAMWVWRS